MHVHGIGAGFFAKKEVILACMVAVTAMQIAQLHRAFFKPSASVFIPVIFQGFSLPILCEAKKQLQNSRYAPIAPWMERVSGLVQFLFGNVLLAHAQHTLAGKLNSVQDPGFRFSTGIYHFGQGVQRLFT